VDGRPGEGSSVRGVQLKCRKRGKRRPEEKCRPSDCSPSRELKRKGGGIPVRECKCGGVLRSPKDEARRKREKKSKDFIRSARAGKGEMQFVSLLEKRRTEVFENENPIRVRASKERHGEGPNETSYYDSS